MDGRQLPPPWSAELQPNYYVVRDANKQQLAYVYYENVPGRRSAAKLLTKDEARREQTIKLSDVELRNNWDSDFPTPRRGSQVGGTFAGTTHDCGGLQPKLRSRNSDVVVPLLFLDSGKIEQELHCTSFLSLGINKIQTD
jgi:hypothetical protein